jgi:glycosyltransferase involved in cell wall biosynthesis
MTLGQPPMVVVRDQVAELGGSERLLREILDLYPGVPGFALRFSSTNVPAGTPSPWDGRVRLFGPDGARRHYLLPLYARRVATQPLGDAKLVLSVTHMGWSAAAAVPEGARHLCHTAGLPRPLYGHSRRYLRDYPAALRPVIRAAIPGLRAHWRALMRRPDRLLTASKWSARGIEGACGRPAEVVYPPVATDFFTPEARPRRHFLAVARLVPHKRIDVLLDAFRGLDEELVVAGGGPWRERLASTAPPNVTFTGYVDDDELRDLCRSSRALIHPSVEEFGIAMAEAQATGTPVIAPRAGGALEIVEDGRTGLLLDRVDASSVAGAVSALGAGAPDVDACRTSAERFSRTRFTDAIGHVVEEELSLAGVRAEPPARAAPVAAGRAR